MSARNDQAEALHLKLYYSTKLLKLVALKSETVRVLLDVETLLESCPDTRRMLRQNVNDMTGWQDQKDPTAEILDYLAHEIEEASNGLLDLAFDRSQAGKGVQS